MVSVDNRSSEDKQGLSHLNITIHYKDRTYNVGLLWKRQQNNLQNNYSAALRQFKSLQTSLGKEENLKERYSQTIESDLKKGYVSELETSDNISMTLCWYLPHHPVLNPKLI